MIQQQLEIPLSPYAGLYDIVVPQDDIYRQLDRLVDFSFVYKREFEIIFKKVKSRKPSNLQRVAIKWSPIKIM